MKHVLKFLKDYIVALIFPLFLCSGLDIVHAFDPHQDKIELAKGQNLAINSQIAQLSVTNPLGQLAASHAAEQAAQEKIEKEIKPYASHFFTGVFEPWWKSAEGQREINEFKSYLIRNAGFEEDEIDERHVADGIWFFYTAERGVPTNIQDITSFVQEKSRPGANGSRSQLQIFLERHMENVRNMHRMQKDSFDVTHRGLMKEEVFRVVTASHRYREIDMDRTPEGWDEAYDRFLDSAEFLVNLKAPLVFQNRQNNFLFQNTPGEQGVNVFKELIEPLVDFEYKDIVYQKGQEEVLRQQLQALLKIFRLSGKAKPLRADYPDHTSFEKARRTHKTAQAIYAMLSDYELRFSHIERAQDQRDPSRPWATKILQQLWQEYSRKYDLTEADLNDFSLQNQIAPDALTNITNGTFRLAKKIVSLSANTEIYNYPFYTAKGSKDFINIVTRVFHWIVLAGLFVGIIMLIFSSYIAIWMIFVSLTYLFVVQGLRNLWLVYKTPVDYTPNKSKAWAMVAAIGAAAVAGLLVFTATSFLAGLVSFVGLTPLIIVAGYFFIALVWRITTALLFHKYSNTYKMGNRDFVGFMKTHVNGELKAMASATGPQNIDRNTVSGRYLADMVATARMLQYSYLRPELKHAAQTGDHPLDYNARTIANFYWLAKDRMHNVTFFGPDSFAQSDHNLAEFFHELTDERRKILAQRDSDGTSLLTRFNQFERGMDLREYAMIHQFKRWHDTEIMTTEEVTGEKDRSATHSLGLGLDKVNELKRKIESSRFYAAHGGLQIILSDALKDKPENPSAKANEIAKTLSLSEGQLFRDEIIRPLEELFSYHKNNQFLLQKLDRQRVDNTMTAMRLKIAEDFWSWSTTDDGKDIDFLDFFETHYRVETNENEGFASVVKIADGSTLFSLPISFAQMWADYVRLSKEMQARGKTDDFFQDTNIKLVRDFNVAKSNVIDALVKDLELYSKKKDTFLAGSHQYGFLTDTYYWVHLKKIQAYLTAKGITTKADIEDLKKKLTATPVETGLIETELYDLEVRKRLASLLGETDIAQLNTKITASLKSIEAKWKQDSFLPNVGKIVTNDTSFSADTFFQSLDKEIMNAMAGMASSAALASWQSSSFQTIYGQFKDWRRNTLPVREFLAKWIYHMRDNVDKVHMRGSILDQMADERMKVDTADELAKPKADRNKDFVPGIQWLFSHDQIVSEYSDHQRPYWEKQLEVYKEEMEKFNLEEGYAHKFSEQIDMMFDIEKTSDGKIQKDIKPAKMRWLTVGKVLVAIVCAFLGAYVLGLLTGGPIAVVMLSATTILMLKGNLIFTIILGVIGGVLALKGIVSVISTMVHNSKKPLGAKRTGYLSALFFVGLGAFLIAFPYFMAPLIELILLSSIGPGVSLVITVISIAAILVAYELMRRGKPGAKWLIGLALLSTIFTFSPVFSLVCIAAVVLVRYGMDKLVQDRSPFIGTLCFSAGVVFLFAMLFVMVPLIAPSASALTIMFYKFMGVTFLVSSLVLLFWYYFRPLSRFSSDKTLVDKTREMKKMLDDPGAHYQFSTESINPITIFKRQAQRRRFEGMLRDLRLRLERRYGTAQEAVDGMTAAMGGLTEKEQKNLLGVVKLALLTKNHSGKEVLYRNIDMEHRLAAPEAYNLLDDRGKADMTRRTELRKGVHMSLGARALRYIEEHSETIYFSLIFGLAAMLTLMFSFLIFYLTGSLGLHIAQIVLTFVLIPILFILLVNNTSLFVDRWMSMLLPTRSNPEAELPYGLNHSNIVSFSCYYTPQHNQRSFEQTANGNSAEETERGRYYGLSAIDEWFNKQQETLRYNPKSKVMIASNCDPEYIVYELMCMMRLAASKEDGWNNLLYTHDKGTWLKKPGKISDNMAYLSNSFLDDEHYLQEMMLHEGWRNVGKQSMFDPEYRIQIVIGGNDFDMSNPADRMKKQKRDEMEKAFLEGYQKFQSTKDFKILTDLYSKYIKDGVAYKPAETYKNNGVGMDLLSEKDRADMVTGDGRIGTAYYNGFDSDNVLPRNLQLNIFAPSHTRYMRKVGNQQPRTYIDNDQDSVFAASTRYVHDTLQFTQQNMYRNFNAFSDYGKGSKVLAYWYLELQSAHKMRQDTLSHDTQESPGWFLHYRLHNMGFSMFNSNIGVGEGTVSNYIAGSIRTGRWLFGTMQDMRNLGEPGSTRQKWIGFLAIKGYWNELIFFLYLFVGFSIVLFNVLTLSSTVLYPTLILLGIWMASMYMIVFASKYVDLNLLPGGAKKNLHLSWEETKMSTAIYLNNPVTVARYDMKNIDSIVQEKSTGVPLPVGWTSQVVVEKMFKSATKRQTFLEMHWQIKMGILVIFTLLFAIFFVPATGLVWSTVLIYFFWAFPLYFSLLYGWYVAYLAGQDRDAFVSAYLKATQDNNLDKHVSKVSNVMVDKAFDEAWQGSKWNEFYNSLPWDKGIHNRYGEHMADIRAYQDTLAIEDAAERQAEQDRICLKVREKTRHQVNSSTLKLWNVLGVLFLVAALFGVLQVTLLTGWGVVGTAVIPVLATLAGWGLFMLLTGFLASKFGDKEYRPEAFGKDSYQKYNRKQTNLFWAKTAHWLLVLSGFSLLMVGIVALALGLTWFSGFMVYFPIVVGFVLSVIALYNVHTMDSKERKYDVFSTTGDRTKTVERFREWIKEKLWASRNTAARRWGRKLQDQMLAPYLGTAKDPEAVKKLSKEALYQLFSDVSVGIREEELVRFTTGSELDEPGEVPGTTKYAKERQRLFTEFMQPLDVWKRVEALGQLQGSPYQWKTEDQHIVGQFAAYLEGLSSGDGEKPYHGIYRIIAGELQKHNAGNLPWTDFLADSKLWANVVKDMTKNGDFRQAYAAYAEDYYIPSVMESAAMRDDKHASTPFGGVLGAVFYNEFRDMECNDALTTYADAVLQGIMDDPALMADVQNLVLGTRLLDGQTQLIFDYHNDADQQRTDTWTEFFMNSLDSLNRGMLFKHGENIRQMIRTIAGENKEKMVEIFRNSAQVQAAILYAQMSVLKHMKSDVAVVDVQQSLNDRFQGSAITKDNYQQRALELDLLKRYQHLLMRLFLRDTKVRLSAQSKEDIMGFLVSRPSALLATLPAFMSWPDQQSQDKVSADAKAKAATEDKTPQQIDAAGKAAAIALVSNHIKSILEPIFKLTEKGGFKNIRIFDNFVQVYVDAHRDFFQAEDHKKALYDALSAITTTATSHTNYWWKHITGAEFSMTKGWRLPHVWNGITTWIVIKKVFYLGLAATLGAVFGLVFVYAGSQIGIGLGFMASGTLFTVGGPMFLVVAAVFLLICLAMHKFSAAGYKLDNDIYRSYHVMGEKARVNAQAKTRLWLLSVFGIILVSLTAVPAMSMGLFAGVMAILFMGYYVSFGIVRYYVYNAELKALFKNMMLLGQADTRNLSKTFKDLNAWKVEKPKDSVVVGARPLPAIDISQLATQRGLSERSTVSRALTSAT